MDTLFSKSKYAVFFSGENGYITIPNIASVTGTNSTRMIWIYVKSVPTNQQWIIGQGSRESIIIQDNGKVAFTNLFPQGWEMVEDSIVVPTNRWVHYAAVETVDSLSVTITLYRDGNLIKTKSILANPKVNSGCDLFIGGVKIGGNGECQFNTPQSFLGLIDEASIWSAALTQEQIRARMKILLTSQENGLVAYYSFENNKGVIVTDDSGHNNMGQISSSGASVIPLKSPFISIGVIEH
jgi:hypothetical protein